LSHSDNNAHAELAECDSASTSHAGWGDAPITILVCAALLLGLGVTFVYKNIAKEEAVAFARDCAAHGGRVRMELNLRQCIGAKQEDTQNDR
jgi:hypothetical protein